MPAGALKVFPVELAHTAFVPAIEQVGDGFTVKTAAVEVAMPHRLLKTARY
jgi:hypothetical protein